MPDSRTADGPDPGPGRRPGSKGRGASPRAALVEVSSAPVQDPLHKGFDPEMLYVECGGCGAPLHWEPGKAARLVREAGLDPLELDASCMLVSDGCPACTGSKGPFEVRVCRLTQTPSHLRPRQLGNA